MLGWTDSRGRTEPFVRHQPSLRSLPEMLQTPPLRPHLLPGRGGGGGGEKNWKIYEKKSPNQFCWLTTHETLHPIAQGGGGEKKRNIPNNINRRYQLRLKNVKDTLETLKKSSKVLLFQECGVFALTDDRNRQRWMAVLLILGV